MKRKRIVVLFVALVLSVLAVATLLGPTRRASLVSAAEDKPKGKLTKVFRKNQSNKNDPLPDWVDQAFKKGKGHLKQGGREWSRQLIDVESELDVETAEEDDFGETRVRVGQVFNGVPVIGGQLIIHEDANGVREVDGRGFSAGRQVDTKPTIKAKDALDVAQVTLGYKGKFANEPEANLVILPNEMMDPKNRFGANLVYVVELLIEDGTAATARHFYYIDANDGHVVWHYNALTTVDDGTGNSLYSGTVAVATRQVNNQYWLQDPARGIPDPDASPDPNTNDQTVLQSGSWTTDFLNQVQECDIQNDATCVRNVTQIVGPIFTNTYPNNTWGDGTSNNRQTAAADAHFGVMKTWDYYANTYQRYGIDNKHYRMLARVHYGASNYANAFWNGKSLAFGDNGGNAFVSMDLVGHEYTHGVFEKALGVDAQHPLIYAGEVGAFNESFADIFGTAVEFYVREHQCIPCQPDGAPYRTCQQQGGSYCLAGNYFLGEDIYNGSNAQRDMGNPTVYHYNLLSIGTPNLHTNGGIQNKAFWLLAQNSTNTNASPYNQIAVTGIGRTKAEKIFYRALTGGYLTYSDRLFYNVRTATLAAACANPPLGYGPSSQECASTGQAWAAVGVPANDIDAPRDFVLAHYRDFLFRNPDVSGWDFWTNQITSCAVSDQACIDTHRVNVSAAFFISIEFQQTGYLVERMYKTAYGDASGTSTLGGSHTLSVPIIRFENEFVPDTKQIGQGVVVGQTGWETVLENNKQNFASQFVQRSRFTSAFPTSMTPTQFVDALNANAGNVLSSTDRANVINLFGGAGDTSNTSARAQAVRQVAENQNLVNAEFNRAFVLMQYFGYLRRDPNSGHDIDYTGYDFWLQKLNQFNGNYQQAEMIPAFINSVEYRQRFGPA